MDKRTITDMTPETEKGPFFTTVKLFSILGSLRWLVVGGVCPLQCVSVYRSVYPLDLC